MVEVGECEKILRLKFYFHSFAIYKIALLHLGSLKLSNISKSFS